MPEGNEANTWPPQLRTACTNPAEMIPASTSRSMSRPIKQSSVCEPWTGYLIIAADPHSYHCMTPTLGQEHTTHLRIGSFAKLIAASAKCFLIDLYISHI